MTSTDLLPSSDRDRAVPSRPRRRTRTTVLTVIAACAVVGVFAGGWYAATAFESPAQRAAKAAAPAKSIITAPVTQGDLSETLTANGTVGRAQTLTAAIPAGDGSSVITGTPVAKGAQVGAGTVVAEVDGAPVFAIPGAFPFYRDMSVGDTGPDVKQLQNALNAAGFNITADGHFGATTAAAVRLLYTHAGYAAALTAAASDSSSGTGTGTGTADTSSSGASNTATGSADGTAGNASASKAASASNTAASTPTLTVPAAQFAVFSTLPGSLASIPAVGSSVDDKATISIDDGSIVAAATVSTDVSGELTAGMHGTIVGPDGKSIAVTVGSVPAASQTASSVSVPLTAGQTLPTAWLGHSILATITTTNSATNALLVPTTAVVTAGHGHAHLLKQTAKGTFTEIDVTELATLNGRSAVRAAHASDLRAGDKVKVG
jgi:peptidoglycan hydrolase-like protein with peptidoglycan-binding domain